MSQRLSVAHNVVSFRTLMGAPIIWAKKNPLIFDRRRMYTTASNCVGVGI